MSSHVPPEFQDFFSKLIHPLNAEPLKERIRVTGLHTLSVKDLKLILRSMERMDFVREQGAMSSASSLRKQQLIDRIRNLIYADFPACTRVKPGALEELSTLTSSAPSKASSKASTASTKASNPGSAMHAAAGLASAPQAQFRNNFGAPCPVAYLPPQFYNGLLPGQIPPFAINPQFLMAAQSFAYPNAVGQTMQSSALPGSSSSSAVLPNSVRQTKALSPAKRKLQTAQSSETTSVRVKTEKVGGNSVPTDNATAALPNSFANPEEQPQNGLEASLLAQLLAMGFPDRIEILTAIRRLAQQENHASLTADQVMFDIITARDAADEARRMDEARLASEQARKEEARRRRQVIEAQLEDERRQASWTEWLENNEMFSDSWILRLSGVRNVLEPLIVGDQNVKVQFLALLKLEKQARKWYGSVLPRTFFQKDLANRLCSLHTSIAVAGTLEKEVKELQAQMFALSEQQGGVPRLFLDSHDARTEHDIDDGNSDDAVVVVRSELVQDKTSSPESKSEQKTIKVIEIL